MEEPALEPREPDPPSEPASARAQLEHRYSRLGLDPRRLSASHKGTIVESEGGDPHERSTIDGVPETLGASVNIAPAAAAAAAAASTAVPAGFDPLEIVLGPVVGTGGMGIVNIAQQPALRREVAVKRLRPERSNRSAVNSLLREAWVTGTLEHPNIVPIHLLVEVAGSPRVVMKRIEGVTWDTLLESPELVDEFDPRGRGAAADAKHDRILFHLRILIEVCQAMQFAHARGVLHLDLKPENVMVGRFGEVYVVDWGIAASLPDIGPTWLPLASSIRSVRGTPSWMPPELATADGERVGVTSDVYLLGGLLHAILTDNEQRHHGHEMIDLLAEAYESRPHAYGPKVPPELAGLANRATARDPAARPASAEAFRQAVEDYLEHRHSTELEARASAGKDHLIAFFARAGRGVAEATNVGQNLRRDFLECRIGFRQALEIWPGNVKAKQGLQEVLRAMATFALDNEQLERAAESVAELSPPDAELEQRLKALRGELARRHERLIALERDASMDTFRETRSLMSFATALLFIVWNIVCGLLHRSGMFVFEVSDLLWFNAATFALFVCSAWVVRKSLLTTATNRRLVVLFGSGFVAILTFWFAAWMHGKAHPERALGALEVVALSNWAYAFFTLVVAFTMDMRAIWIALPVTLIAMLSPLAEPYAFELLGLEGFLCGAWLAFIWRGPDPAKV